MMTRLQLRHVGKVYPGDVPTNALNDINLSIVQGDFVAIEGPSGGGKSTLLNILGLLDASSTGSYRIDDQDVAHLGVTPLARVRSDRFAFIFQAFHLLERRRVSESVELGLLYRGLPGRERRTRALAALKTVGMEAFAHQRANKLSGGQRQRVAIARALAAEAPIILADEPTGNLDSANGRAVAEALEFMNSQGSTVVLVTHSRETADIASRKVAMKDGVIIADERTRAIVESADPPTPPGRASHLRLRDLARDAYAGVSSRIGRTLSLSVSVAVAVGLAVATFGISETARAQVADTFDAHANRDVTVTWYESESADGSLRPGDELVSDLGAIAGVDAAAIISSYGSARVQPNLTRPTLEVTLYGQEGSFESATRSSITWASGHSGSLGANEVLIGSTLAEQLHLGPIDASPAILVQGEHMRVVGTISSSPRIPDALGALVLTSAEAARLGYPDMRAAMLLTSPAAAQQVAAQAPIVIDPAQPEALTVSAPIDPTTLRQEVQREVQLALVVFTFIAVLAAIASLANTTLLAVLERRPEFGLRRAVGARPAHIFSLVLSESLMTGAIGGAIGLVGGIVSILIVTVINRWSPVFDPWMAPASIIGGIVVGALGGAAASIRAARIRPSDALRA